MQSLKQMLRVSEPFLLPIFAEKWGVDTHRLSNDEIIDALEARMLDADRAEAIFDALSDDSRGALQALMGSGGQMNYKMFSLLYGEIRPMGAGKVEREKPHLNPENIAETLYYRGLIGRGTDQVGVGLGSVIFVPDDLGAILPLHKTGYSADALDALVDSFSQPDAQIYLDPVEEDEVVLIAPADTSIVDDLTTLIAYIQVAQPRVDRDLILGEDVKHDVIFFMMIQDTHRLDFLFQIAISADLIEINDGRAYTRRADVRRWLEDTRSSQLRLLVDAWQSSVVFRDLWHTPGLFFDSEAAGASYNPVEARSAVLKIMREYVPMKEWWMIDGFIDVVKARNPDFQRPGGDYDSWYIRNEEDDFLNGIESWDAVEGAVLEFYIMGPMHWLGLVDVGEFTARLNAYGRALIYENQSWVETSPDVEKLTFQDNGVIEASRKVSRFERFQLARFANMVHPATTQGEPFIYRIEPESLGRASDQGINISHIQAFLNKHLGDTSIPDPIKRLLDTWRGGGAVAHVTLERILVLRTTSAEVLDSIVNSPALRRYLGARLGPTSVAVREDQWDVLRMTLGENGIATEVKFD